MNDLDLFDGRHLARFWFLLCSLEAVVIFLLLVGAGDCHG